MRASKNGKSIGYMAKKVKIGLRDKNSAIASGCGIGHFWGTSQYYECGWHNHDWVRIGLRSRGNNCAIAYL